MEVIKHGNTYKEVECKKCGALLSYCEADIKKESSFDDDYFGRLCWTEKKSITCPECKNVIKLKYLIDGSEQEL